MKSTLAITAGCLIAALAVGDTVYRIAPKPGRTYAEVVTTKGGLGDISQLTDQDDDDMVAKTLDELFAEATKDGIDAEELASIRELALIAKPHDSSWGEDFFKNADGKVGGASQYVMASTSSAWDTTLGTNMATSATSGPMSYFASGGGASNFVDEFSLATNGSTSGPQYGGEAGSGSGAGSSRTAAIVSSLGNTQVFAVPEPTSLGAFGLGVAAILRRRRRA